MSKGEIFDMLSNSDINVVLCSKLSVYIEQLQQENQQLKDDNNILKERYQEIVNYAYEISVKRDKYKFVLDEIREYIKDTCWYPEVENYSNMCDYEVVELIKILDKVK